MRRATGYDQGASVIRLDCDWVPALGVRAAFVTHLLGTLC